MLTDKSNVLSSYFQNGLAHFSLARILCERQKFLASSVALEKASRSMEMVGLYLEYICSIEDLEEGGAADEEVWVRIVTRDEDFFALEFVDFEMCRLGYFESEEDACWAAQLNGWLVAEEEGNRFLRERAWGENEVNYF